MLFRPNTHPNSQDYGVENCSLTLLGWSGKESAELEKEQKSIKNQTDVTEESTLEKLLWKGRGLWASRCRDQARSLKPKATENCSLTRLIKGGKENAVSEEKLKI